ncbi:Gfo/Idh/MocA family protein [Paenibacillus eucommiae]|uniref:Dehydrogenase n=1 Tax=Paenibacillus eucommiae TaxID=1355755 RepID=A0ABS4J9U9_9BACL|nr:Gfo/Idh/MocA family oxidoreductase [Paenibacillus eucommiae]MBP1996619.1 putative dehydrogenase [Paenibacillus eucommiae]
MNKIRLGIIGCGIMSENHAKGYQELTDQMIVTATADIVLERAQNMADSIGEVGVVVTDYRDLLDHVDAVLIALPHDLHYEVSSYFLNAGKHVLVEKPLALNEQQCLELIDTSKQTGNVLMTAYPMRFHPLVVKMKELIDNKVYGELFQISMWTEQFTRYEPGHWALSADRLGGGQFFSHGCHYVDLLLWIMGRPVKGVHMGTNKGTPWMEKEGTSHVTIEFESGAIGYHAGTWGARGTKLGWSFHAHCTDGMIEFNYGENKLVIHKNLLKEDRPDSQEPGLEVIMELEGGGKYTFHEIRHFLNCIQNGESPLTDGPSSLQGLRVIWRMYEAERQGIIADLRGLGLDEEWKPVTQPHVV